MKFSLTVHTLFAVAIYGLVAGCGTMGGTSQFIVPIEQSRASPPKNHVDFGSFTLVSEGNIVISAGTFHWGAFTKNDEENFIGSLTDTLNTVDWPSVEDPNSAWKIHVILRRHIMAHDNNSGGVLTVISWALASTAGKIVYQEQFYATRSVVLFGTIGGLKDTVNKAAVQRIVETSLRLASSKGLPGSAVNTYNSMHEASATLPKRFQSWPMVWMEGEAIALLFFGKLHKKVNWEIMDAKEPIDWEKHISSKKQGKL